MTEQKNQEQEKKAASILIVGDHGPLRTSLRDWVGINLSEVRILESGDIKEVTCKAFAERPHIILLDTGMNAMGGIDATEWVRKFWQDAKMVILTMCENPEYIQDAKAAGASACILKRDVGVELISALRELLPEDGDGLGITLD
jgi:DNA-binding NarL/FixJ family response regulator